MSEERVVRRSERRGVRGITGALVLIALGAAFLLNNLGIIDVNWFSLWRYWPVLLIVVGLDLLLSRSVLGSLVAAVVGLALLAGVFLLASTGRGPDPLRVQLGDVVTTPISAELDDADNVTVQIDLGAGEASIGTSASGDLALEGTYRTREDLDIAVRESRRAGTLNVLLEQSGQVNNFGGFQPDLLGELNLMLTDEVPVGIVLNSGASSVTMDLRALELTTLEIDGGVGSLEVTLPDAGEYEVDVEGGIGSFEITIPDSVEARLEVDAGLSSTNVPARFEKIDDGVWETNGYGSADDQALIRVSAGIGSINFR